MSNKTFIPAFRAKVGDWNYYICIMKYAEVARSIGFAHDLGGNADLKELLQRGIGARTEQIRDYLLNSTHRFLGALIVAVWGGDPEYYPLGIDDPKDYLKGADDSFGVLSFDGSQSYFALDGQHRLKAIKEAMAQNPSLGNEEIAVIMVSHYDTEDGRERTRRLFTNINKNAKQTTAAENIALDEDDAASIITRRLIAEHPFLSKQGVVKVFGKKGASGDFKLALANISQSEPKAVTTISTLYDLVSCLRFDLPRAVQDKSVRPSADDLENAYDSIAKKLDELFENATGLRAAYDAVSHARELRAPKDKEGEGHPFMRPLIQKVVVNAVAHAVVQGQSWDDTVNRLSKMTWRMDAAPWLSVFNVDTGKIITASENKELLRDLLDVSLTHSSKQSVKNARKKYREVRGLPYPVEEEVMIESIPSSPSS